MLARDYPDYITVAEVAVLLGISRSAVSLYHQDKIPSIQVDTLEKYGIEVFGWRHAKLWRRTDVEKYGKKRRRNGAGSRLAFKGIEVERMQKICERFYRQNLDIGDPELIKLAKRVAKL